MVNELIRFGARVELARRRFFDYCKLKAPDFYRESRQYIVNLCDKIQEFLEGDWDLLVINLPPRFGKSRTAQLAVEWILGKDKTRKIMTGSYNELLSGTFAKGVRNSIQEEKGDELIPVFTDVFPGVKIAKGDGSASLWSLEGGHNNYLATSPKGSATGFGANLIIIDDLIKNAEEAYNDRIKEEHYQWFVNTMLSRLEEGGKIIVIMTRWGHTDLAGRVLEHYTETGKKVMHINYKAKQDDGTMLCEEILSKATFDFKMSAMNSEIFLANYQQEPIDIQGRLYSHFKTYEQLPHDSSGRVLVTDIRSYTDTADKGADWLCSIVYAVYQHEGYIMDILFTKQPMEYTEPATAEMFIRNKVNNADIESNNGGRGFGRNVKEIMKKKGWIRTHITDISQTSNKESRILSNATAVQDHIYMPIGWEHRFPEFYQALMSYQKEGKNEHDDAPDALTGCWEMICKGQGIKINSSILWQ